MDVGLPLFSPQNPIFETDQFCFFLGDSHLFVYFGAFPFLWFSTLLPAMLVYDQSIMFYMFTSNRIPV